MRLRSRDESFKLDVINDIIFYFQIYFHYVAAFCVADFTDPVRVRIVPTLRGCMKWSITLL